MKGASVRLKLGSASSARPGAAIPLGPALPGARPVGRSADCAPTKTSPFSAGRMTSFEEGAGGGGAGGATVGGAAGAGTRGAIR